MHQSHVIGFRLTYSRVAMPLCRRCICSCGNHLCSLPVLRPCSVSEAAVLQVVAVAFAHAGDQVYVAGVENVIKVRPGVCAVCCYATECSDVKLTLVSEIRRFFLEMAYLT